MLKIASNQPNKLLPMPFSVRDILRFCEFLERNRDFARLRRFLWSLPGSLNSTSSSETIAVYRAVAAFHARDFHELYRLLEGREFSATFHEKLQRLWFEARYIEAEARRMRCLDAVGKYRVRKKYPSPRTISAGRATGHCFDKETRNMLNEAYEQKPYPTLEEKRNLADKTKLSVTQVSNWFKNKRQRVRMTKQRKSDLDSETWPAVANTAYYPYFMYEGSSGFRGAEGRAWFKHS